MTELHIQLLSETVALHDAGQTPVTPAELAAEVDADRETISDWFEEFESKYLLQRVGDGYRPTVTARELLELDVDDSALLVLDAEPEG